MNALQWWMRLVGVFYLLMSAGALTRMAIRVEGPEGLLERAAAGEPTARLVVDTWVTFGLALGVIGVSLLFFSRAPEGAGSLVKTVIALELGWGIPIDIYKIVRGYKKSILFGWMAMHVLISLTGLAALARAGL